MPVELTEEIHVYHHVSAACRVRVRTVWTWRETDPLVVEVTFHDSVKWSIGRDVLADGIEGDAGLFEVRVFRTFGPLFALRLLSPAGQATYTVPVKPVTALLRRSFVAVPRSAEVGLLAVAVDAWSRDGAR